MSGDALGCMPRAAEELPTNRYGPVAYRMVRLRIVPISSQCLFQSSVIQVNLELHFSSRVVIHSYTADIFYTDPYVNPSVQASQLLLCAKDGPCWMQFFSLVA